MKLFKLKPFIAAGLGLLLLAGCYKAENFHAQLSTLPQVDNGLKYAYENSYTVGDTMTITGVFNPKNNLQIKIGDYIARIVASDTFSQKYHDSFQDTSLLRMDRVKILINDSMGSGKNIPVSITSGGFTTFGHAVTIYSTKGKGGVDKPLKITDYIAEFDFQNLMLKCPNGKGDLYYIDASTGNLVHIKKGGAVETLLTASQITGGQTSITSYIAGTVNPQGTRAWISVQTPSGFSIIEANLASKAATILNSTPKDSIAKQPYTGQIDRVNIKSTLMYADSAGNVYMAVKGNSYNDEGMVALARYNSNDKTLSYQFRGQYVPADIPGTIAPALGNIGYIRIQPDEQALYVFQGSQIYVYDLLLRSLIKKVQIRQEQYGVLPKNYYGDLESIKLPVYDLASASEVCFGWLPMKHYRLSFLLYQYIGGSDWGNYNGQVGGPKWMLFDFMESRSYQYSPDRADIASYSFSRGSIFKDELLNSDEEGNLYSTANGRRKIVKTINK